MQYHEKNNCSQKSLFSVKKIFKRNYLGKIIKRIIKMAVLKAFTLGKNFTNTISNKVF